MRAAVIVGIILIAAGIYVAAGQASYKSSRDVLKIGGLEASVKESHMVPQWAGGVAIVVGGLLVFAGVRPAKR
jgi:predicted transporter